MANVPGTSTFALSTTTLPCVLKLANHGYVKALADDRHFRIGLNVHKWQITQQEVAAALGYDYVDPLDAMKTGCTPVG